MSQSSFDFPVLDNYLDDDFLCSKENKKAFDFVSNYNLKNNDLPKIFAVIGKRHSGKSHLAHIWQRKTDAVFLNLNNLKDFEVASHIKEGKSYIIKNVEETTNQIALFHIFNIILEKDCQLMVTSSVSLELINYEFADLESRLKNIFSIEIEDPDVEFIKMILVKQFSKRQLVVEDKVIDFIAKNIDRNYHMIDQIGKLLEFYCFEHKRKITIPFVTDVMSKASLKIV